MGLIVIRVLPALIVASKAISDPDEFESFSVISASTLVLVISESSIFRTASLNEIVTLPLVDTLLAPFAGEKVTTVAFTSAPVKVAFAA